MSIRLPYLAMALFILTGIAAAVALSRMNNLPAFIVMAPGYLVQAWLFETHRGSWRVRLLRESPPYTRSSRH